ncbi:MAG: HDOD domain-containing protein [Betaproteobacteria bacterium]|nr:HDOD domain-containing protein [Betaproteobacteria bacterium]
MATNTDKTGEALKAQRFQMLIDIAEELRGDIAFPSYFEVTLRLRKALNDPNADEKGIAQLISMEPVIASKLISVANSVAYNAAGHNVRDLLGAIARLGLRTVHSIAVQVAMKQMLQAKDMACFGEFAEKLWKHSLQTAAYAEVIAERLTRLKPGEVRMMGLIHDLGAFYMLYRAAHYEELRARPDTVRHLTIQWHESIGESLLQALGFDEEFVAATSNHDQPRTAPYPPRTLADVLYVANLLAGGPYVLLPDSKEADRRRAELGEAYLALEPEMAAKLAEITASLA